MTMKSHLYHLQVNIDFSNLSFYQELMSFLGWQIIFGTEEVVGYKSGQSGDIWFCKALKDGQGDFDKTGVNHVSIRVENKEDVDSVVGFLQKNNITPLFDTPRHRSEFASDENETYYQVMFASPDNILFELVYIGAKT
jgi:hypothetical protein